MSGYDMSSVLTVVQDISTPSVSDFLKHPNHRQIASFFLGCVFISSLLRIMTSPVVRRLYRRCFRVFDLGQFIHLSIKIYNENSAPWNNIERPMETFLLDDQASRITFSEDRHWDLILILSICFAFASIAHFSSLLSFQSSNGSSACSFFVAWGGISAAGGRFLGLIILILDLRQFALHQWEIYLAWSWLVISGAFVFATYTIGVGVIVYVLQLGTYLCYRTIYLPTALTMSIMFITLELYIIGRLLSLIAPPFLEFKHRIGAVTDIRVLRALSLLLLELLCLVPGVKFVGIVSEFVPFSIGTLIVLVMFHKYRTKPNFGEPMPVPPMSIPGSRASIISGLSTQAHIPNAISMQISPFSHNHHGSVASSISVGDYSFNAASPSFGTDVTGFTSRVRHVQSCPQLPDPMRNIISHVPNHGQHGTIGCPKKTHTGPFHHTGLILPKQVNDLESLQDLSSRRGLPIVRSHMKAITPPSTQSTSQPRSLDSVAYGSDIIQLSHISYRKVTKRPPRHSCSPLPLNGNFLSPLESTSSFVSHCRTNSSHGSVPVTYEPSSCLEAQHDEWSRFGDCNLSSSMRKTFGDQSLSPSISQTPAEQFVPDASILLRRNTFGEQTFNIQDLVAPQLELQEKARENNSPVDPVILTSITYSPAPPVAGGVRIRGPRPPPKVFSRWNTVPIGSSFGIT